MIDEATIRRMLENIKNDMKYDMKSLDLSNFKPEARKALERLIKNADKLIETIDKVPTVPKMINTLYPVNSVYVTYWQSGTETPPFSFGTWSKVHTIAVSGGTLIFWRRTA